MNSTIEKELHTPSESEISEMTDKLNRETQKMMDDILDFVFKDLDKGNDGRGKKERIVNCSDFDDPMKRFREI